MYVPASLVMITRSGETRDTRAPMIGARESPLVTVPWMLLPRWAAAPDGVAARMMAAPAAASEAATDSGRARGGVMKNSS
jgi:hypothetical protein